MQAKPNQAAFDCGQFIERIAPGYYVHRAVIEVATDPRARALIPALQPGQAVPIGTVCRKDGTLIEYYFEHFLEQVQTNPVMADDLDRIWLAGSLLAVGDAAKAHEYFDRAPELELLRHLRNGVAHGNRFKIDNPASLAAYPAHNKLAWWRSDTGAEFEITPSLHGKQVLFDFMGPGDVMDLLYSIGIYLIRMGNGDPLRGYTLGGQE
jgi:hypothetical protein